MLDSTPQPIPSHSEFWQQYFCDGLITGTSRGAGSTPSGGSKSKEMPEDRNRQHRERHFER